MSFEPDLSNSTGRLHQQGLSYGSQFGTLKAPSLRVGDGFSKDRGNLQNLLVCNRQSKFGRRLQVDKQFLFPSGSPPGQSTTQAVGECQMVLDYRPDLSEPTNDRIHLLILLVLGSLAQKQISQASQSLQPGYVCTLHHTRPQAVGKEGAELSTVQ